MKTLALLVFSLVLLTVVAGGCTHPAPEDKPGPVTRLLATPVTPATTAMPPENVTVPSADPIIGMWRGYNNLPTGQIERVWIFSKNGTWIMRNMNVKSQMRRIVLGTWRRGDDGLYQIFPPDSAMDTFTYDKENDRLSSSYFRETYLRIASLKHAEREPTMNITVHSAQRVSALGRGHPHPGNKFLIINISIKNLNETGWYTFSDENIWVTPDGEAGLAPIKRFSGDTLVNLFPLGKIAVGEERQGNVIFGVPERSQSFTLKLFNGLGEIVSNVVELNNVPAYDEYVSGSA